ncbi:BTAD domain-containing putative transcriptional regulator [Microbacterium sp. B2969]|uniref:BTAD domain-containing putative transcriptional regulator n=1 Tax=Microbacterium alkaliflavum TaxID=3248839 RepID=A0ABW7Q930_9MICO
MDLRVLGALTIDGDGAALAPRDRLVLGALAVRIGRPVSVESLARALWGDDLPPSWSKVIPGCIMRLRRRIAPARIETTAAGYRLAADGIDLDAERFERCIARGAELLELGEPDRAVHAISEALVLWRDQPFAELSDWEPALIESLRLDELRLSAEESLVEARLQSGELRDAAALARARVAESPMRERRWVLLALAQYRQERQAEALATVRRGREMLANELGLDPGAELAALEQAILRHDPELESGAVYRAASAECPYFGLPPADLGDGERFFGREEQLGRALEALERHGVLIVSGSSGVGKSSFVRAGIGARLIARGRGVSLVTPGEHPLEALRESGAEEQDGVLIIDQCEQALANDDPAVVRRFFEEVGRQVFRGTVVLTIRADRLGELAENRGFAGLIESHLLMLGPLSAEELRTIIEEPARQAGLILEPGLVEVLTRDAGGRSLPLLSHALRQIWQRREGRVLSVDAYKAAGQIEGAVAQTAEEVFGDLSEEGRAHARDILLRLVEPADGGGVICQRVARASVAVDEEHEQVAGRLVDARLVTSDEESYQLAHEAVAREWPRLREWLADDVEGQRILRHLSAAAGFWQAMDRADSELYRGARLSAAAHWRDSALPALSAVEAAFLDASVGREATTAETTRLQLQRERRSVRRLRWLAGAAASLAIVALAAGTVATAQVGEANKQAVIDDARRVAALGESEHEYERALLLSVEAIRLWDSPTTRTALLSVMGRSPRITSISRLNGEASVQQMALAPDGESAVVVDDNLGARLVDLGERVEVGKYAVDGNVVLDAIAAPDGRILLSLMEGLCDENTWCDRPARRTVAPDDMGDGGGMFALPGFDYPAIDLEFSPDQALAAAIAPLPYEDEGDNIAIWRVDAPEAPTLLDLPHAGSNPGAMNWANAFGRVRFSPDGLRLYASGFGPTAIFDTATGELVGEVPGDGILAVSPDGDSLLIREGRTAARIVHLYDPEEDVLLEMPSVVIDGAFSPDGMEVVTTADDRAWLWWAPTGDLRETLEGHFGAVSSAAFRPEGDLVTAGADGAVITWAMGDWTESFRDWERTGDESLVPRDESTLVYELPSGEFTGIAADPDIWLARACAVAGRTLTEEEWRAVFGGRAYDPACAPGTSAQPQ